jgi:hypothetical protein
VKFNDGFVDVVTLPIRLMEDPFNKKDVYIATASDNGVRPMASSVIRYALPAIVMYEPIKVPTFPMEYI